MTDYNYYLQNIETGEKIKLHFNYEAPDKEEKVYYENADHIHYGSNYHGAYYARWVLYDKELEYVPEGQYFTSTELTEEEKQKYIRDTFRLLFINGWVIYDFS